ncbi:hypothetical protein [Thiomonas sp. FB-6]|jgi:hypothetical protein|uniref:hypothetical protein n=1 Tax=Thiomonas sp. FB-6 TaxID=1158291 RepID=UPI00037D2EF4|nr:hypothetical protein [Thiomonas sp. FB-6]
MVAERVAPCFVMCSAVVAMDAMPGMASQHEAWWADGPAIASCIHGKKNNAQANAQ